VTSAPVLTLALTDSPDRCGGANLFYTLAYSNTGTPTHGVVLKDTLPPTPRS